MTRRVPTPVSVRFAAKRSHRSSRTQKTFCRKFHGLSNSLCLVKIRWKTSDLCSNETLSFSWGNCQSLAISEETVHLHAKSMSAGQGATLSQSADFKTWCDSEKWYENKPLMSWWDWQTQRESRAICINWNFRLLRTRKCATLGRPSWGTCSSRRPSYSAQHCALNGKCKCFFN